MGEIRVLLVDDESELVSTMQERMGLRDIQAELALNGAEAMEKLKSGLFNVVVLDIHMPGTSGLDVLKAMKALRPEVEIILLTGRGSEEDRDKGASLGAFDYVVKPVNIEILIEKILQAIEKKSEPSNG